MRKEFLSLPWPLDEGRAASENLLLPGSNVVYDLHGDPCRAELVVVMEGNQFMVIPSLLKAFEERVGRKVSVFYVTLPPQRFKPLVEGRPLFVGNLCVSVRPHVVMGPPEFMKGLYEKGYTEAPATFVVNKGVVLVVQRGNPKGIRGPEDLLREDVKIGISNPVREKNSFQTYIKALSKVQGLREKIEKEALTSEFVHHREVPAMLYWGLVDVAPLYYHFALYYRSREFFPEPLFDYIEFEEGRAARSEYQVALSSECRSELAFAFKEFLLSEEARRIYGRYGFEETSLPKGVSP